VDRRNAVSTLGLLLAMLFYGASFPITKTALDVFSPITIVTFRLIVSAVILNIVNALVHRRKALIRSEDALVFFLIALFQPLGYFLFETFGLQHVSAAVASIMIATIPVFTPMISRFFVFERLTAANFIGLLCSSAGVAILATADGSGGSSCLFGIFLMLGAVVSAIGYTILIKRLPPDYSPLTVTAVQNTIGLGLFLPLFFIFEFDAVHLGEVFGGRYGFEPIASIIFLAIFASSLAFIFLNFGIQVVGPSRANGFTNLIPVITAAVSFFFFDERFTLIKAVGMLVIFSGVIAAQRSKRR
jgi:drug/metabolite transporter (DMT)-like permease